MSDDPIDRDWETLRVARRGHVVEVSLHRLEARNALNGAMMGELTEVARLLHRRTDVLAVILTGGAVNFSAGADLSAIGERMALRLHRNSTARSVPPGRPDQRAGICRTACASRFTSSAAVVSDTIPRSRSMFFTAFA